MTSGGSGAPSAPRGLERDIRHWTDQVRSPSSLRRATSTPPVPRNRTHERWNHEPIPHPPLSGVRKGALRAEERGILVHMASVSH